MKHIGDMLLHKLSFRILASISQKVESGASETFWFSGGLIGEPPLINVRSVLCWGGAVSVAFRSKVALLFLPSGVLLAVLTKHYCATTLKIQDEGNNRIASGGLGQMAGKNRAPVTAEKAVAGAFVAG